MAPTAYSKAALSLHIPRRLYANGLSGIPTIRVFEALACGVPLLCAPWEDAEHLFRPGEDYLVAQSGGEMKQAIQWLLRDDAARRQIAANGRADDSASGIPARTGPAIGRDLRGVDAMRVFVFGSSLTSSYWNGAATYYRGIYKNLAGLGFTSPSPSPMPMAVSSTAITKTSAMPRSSCTSLPKTFHFC